MNEGEYSRRLCDQTGSGTGFEWLHNGLTGGFTVHAPLFVDRTFFTTITDKEESAFIHDWKAREDTVAYTLISHT